MRIAWGLGALGLWLGCAALAAVNTSETVLQNAIARCTRDLQGRLHAASLADAAHPRPGRSPSATLTGETVSSLRLLLAELEPAPTHQKLFRTRFEAFAQVNPPLQELLTQLRKANIELHYFDAENPGGCQGNQLAYFIPGPTRREVGICLSRSEIMGRYWVALAHETLHVFQFSQADLHDSLSLPFGAQRRVSARALEYTPNPKYLQVDDELAQRGRQILSGLSPNQNRVVQSLLRAFDEIKTLYMIYPQGETLEFVPKKPWVIPEQKFYAALEEKLAGYTGWKDESADIRFGAEAAFLPAPVPAGAKADRLRALSEQWSHWLERHPDRKSHSRQVQLQSYLVDLASAYQTMLHGFPAEARPPVEELFHKFFTSSRIMRGLLNYCVEMQANIQSKWLLYLLYQRLQEIPACASIYPTQWEFNLGSDAEENPFAPQYRYRQIFEKIDEAMEKYTRHYISRTQSYGPSFSFLYGYDSFPNIFNAESCRKYKEEYLSFRP